MCEEKKIPQEINEDDLDQVAGGYSDANGNWLCPYCGKAFPEVKSNKDCAQHWLTTCTNSPLKKK